MSGPTPSNFDYSRYTTGSEAAAQASYGIKDGAGGKGIFIQDAIKDLPRFQPSVGQKVIDILVSPMGSRHPLVVSGKLPQGALTHVMWVYIHKGVGSDWWVCPSRTYGKPCPLCEYRNRLKADPDVPDDTVKLYGTGKYATGVYKMVHHLNPSQLTWQEPVMVWDINYSFMESTLQSMAKQPMVTPDAPTGYINFQWPTAGVQGGRHIKFEIKPKGQYFDYDGHQFIVRQNPVPPHVMQAAEAMPPLDELVYVPEYEELQDALQVSLNQPMGGQPTGQAYGGVGGIESYSPPPQPFGTPEEKCPFANYGGVLGQTFDSWQECRTCQLMAKCESMMPQVQQPAPPQPTPVANPVPPMQPTPAPAAPPAMPPIPRRPQR